MLVPVWSLLSAAVLLQTAPAPAQRSWIADLKAKRGLLGSSEVRIEGDVVDIRSTSPSARSGFYRIIDASDPEGLLIRSGRLPRDGGALKVRARKTPQQPVDGMLLLDEIEQTRLGKRPVLPIALATLSLTSFLVLVVLLIRAAVAERRYKLTPPLWLMPEAGPYGKTLAMPGEASEGPVPLKYSPELEEADEAQREQLRKRKRNLFQAVLGSFGFSAASAAWILVTQPAVAQVPAFIFIEAEDSPIPMAQQPWPADTALVQATLDSLLRMMASNPPPVPAGPQRDTSRRTTSPVENPFQAPTRPPVMAAPRVDSAAPPVTPVSAPPPAPAPPPEPSPPPPDPEAERAMAVEAMSQGASRLVQAINGEQAVDVARLTAFRESGVNRISFGAQSFAPHVLATLGRAHDAGRTRAAVREARAAGFDNVNLDLIYGTAGESLDDWRLSLEEAIALEPEHLSAYALTIEAGTAFGVDVATGRMPAPDDDDQAAKYEIALDLLAAAGAPVVMLGGGTWTAQAVADIFELRKGVKLGGLKIKDLIHEGRRI